VLKVQGGRPLAPRPAAAFAAYVALALGYALLVHPHLDAAEPLRSALRHGGVAGLVVYGVYAFTNTAIFAEWPTYLALLETAWGGIVYSLAALAAAQAMGRGT
jgi:uncharacterized membrane protein